MKKILFVCTGNTCRSSMAEALLRNLAKEDQRLGIIVKSAGTAALNGQRASHNAVLALQELSVDLTAHRAQTVTAELIAEADLVLTMTDSHKGQLIAFMPYASNKIFTLAEFTSKNNTDNISDPFGGALAVYIECRNEINEHIKKLFNILISQIGDD